MNKKEPRGSDASGMNTRVAPLSWSLILNLFFFLNLSLAAEESSKVLPYVIVSGTYTDNLNRVEVNKVSEVLESAEIGLRYLQDSRLASVDIDGAVRGVHYENGSADDQMLGRLDANLQLDLIPERAVLLFIDRYGQVASGSYGALNPSNREGVNYASVGPELRFPLGSAASLDFAALAGRSDYENSNIGANRWSAQAAFTGQLNARQSVSLNVQQTSNEMRDLPSQPVLTGQSAFLAFKTLSQRSSFGVNAGYTKVRNEITTDKGFSGSIAFGALLGAYSQMSVDIFHGFRDPVSSFLLSNALTGLGEFNMDQNALIASDYARSTNARVGFQINRERTFLGVGVSWDNDRYVSLSALDREVVGGDLRVGRELGERANVSLFGAFYREVDASDRVNAQLETAGFELLYRFTPRLSLDISAQQMRFKDLSTSIDEVRAYLGLRFELSRFGANAPSSELSPARSRLPDDLLDLRRARSGT